MLNNYLCALDIGSSKIAGCLALLKRGRIENIFLDSVLSKGIRQAAVVDSCLLVNCLGNILKNLKKASGINIRSGFVNLSGSNIITRYSRSIIPLAERGNKVISLSDMERAQKQARMLGLSMDDEILHAIAVSYAIDSKEGIINPLGLYSHRLESQLYLISAKLSALQTITRVLNQSGIEISRVIFSGLATCEAVLDDELREATSVICDLGSDTTQMMIFKEGALKDIEILNIGGDGLTRQLQDALKIPFELAEDIKRSHGLIDEYKHIGQDKELLVKKDDFYKPIKQREVCEITTSGAKAICLQIKETLEKKMPLYEVKNFVVTGRTVLLEGFIETLESILNIPVKIGKINHPKILPLIKGKAELAGHKYLNYVTAIGMVLYTLYGGTAQYSSSCVSANNFFSRAFNKFKEIYQEYF